MGSFALKIFDDMDLEKRFESKVLREKISKSLLPMQ